MKVRFGMLMTSGVGKTGGQCIQRFRGSFVLRNITIPVVRIASLQNKQKSRFRHMSRLWYTLGDYLRNDWRELAGRFPRLDEYGSTYYFTGRQMFFYINNNLLLTNTVRLDASFLPTTAPLNNFNSVVINSSLRTVSVTQTASISGEIIVFKAVRLQSRVSYLNVDKLKIFYAAIGFLTPSELYDLLEESIGVMSSGSAVGFACKSVTVYGISSEWVLFRCIVN